jgi:hypothetical protein
MGRPSPGRYTPGYDWGMNGGVGAARESDHRAVLPCASAAAGGGYGSPARRRYHFRYGRARTRVRRRLDPAARLRRLGASLQRCRETTCAADASGVGGDR